ncbi:MAG: hypothetical protein Q4A43_01115 [Coriobacteriia bacterium]|nr:hypothetical protein [Coriobacteriia bacterium]
MGNTSLRSSNSTSKNFLNLSVAPKRLHLLDVPHGFVSGMAKDNLGHQMRYSVCLLEAELAEAGTAHVLQLALEGDDDRNPDRWTLYADGKTAALGTGEYARGCFLESATAFLDLCREAVHACDLQSWSDHDYQLLSTARKVASL